MIPDSSTWNFIKSEDLNAFTGPVVDVRTPEAYQEAHLPGSVNHCVYEVAFMEEFPKAFPDRNKPVVIYGDGDPHKADVAALGRLQALGYTSVFILRGGLSRWMAHGGATEGTGSTPKTVPSGQLSLDTSRSRVRWVGRNLTNQHDGEVKASGGFMELNKRGTPVAGEVGVDLRQITCRDIEDKDLAAKLIQHLQHVDFFDVANHPEARFVLRSATPISKASPGQPNFTVKGSLHARGRETPLLVQALVEPVDDGYVFQANFNFDRVALGAVYGSGRLFERLGMHLVNDLVSIDVMAVFRD
jgi:rhodanese-related sulfurtransferase